MSQPIDADVLAKGLHSAVMTMRIIVFALAAGATVPLVLMAAISDGGLALPELADPLVWIPVLFALPAIAASFVLPSLVARGMRAKLAAGTLDVPQTGQAGQTSPLAALGDAGKLAMIYQTALIVGCALLLGAAFFCAISILVFNTGLVGLGLGALLIALVLLRFPNARGLASWIADQFKQMEAERTLAGKS